MSSRVTLSSEKRPPWRTRYFLPINVASARAEKLSEKSLKTLPACQYLLRHELGDAMNVPFVILSLAFSLEAIHSVHVISLMVASVQEERRRSQPLVRIQQQRNLGRPGTSVHEVAVEQVPVLIGRRTIAPEKLHQIEVLACRRG